MVAAFVVSVFNDVITVVIRSEAVVFLGAVRVVGPD